MSRYRAEIENALLESFGFAGYKAAYERCASSKRFPTLEAIASHSSQFGRLIVAAKKLADNPNTKAQI